MGGAESSDDRRTLVRRRSETEQWGALSHSALELHEATKRLHATCSALLDVEDVDKLGPLHSAASALVAADAAIVVAWRALDRVCPRPSEQPAHQPVDATAAADDPEASG